MTPGAPALKSSKPTTVENADFPHDYVRQFYTDGTAKDDWYLPSMGEMGFVVARYKKIMEIFSYLESVGALIEDGTDNIPGYGSGSIWTSTVGTRIRANIPTASEPTMSASIPGYGTNPDVYPVSVMVSSTDLQFTLDSDNKEVLPFAMIKKGEIQRTIADYTVANGHQMKDLVAEV